MNEIFYAVHGYKFDNYWIGKKFFFNEGSLVRVGFDYNKVMELNKKIPLLGVYHTHPNMKAYPSIIDDNTMNTWFNTMGKPLICLIKGSDGLKNWVWWNDELTDLYEGKVKKIGDLFFGTYGDDYIE
jgi:hypothetical protein